MSVVQDAGPPQAGGGPPKVSWLYDPKVRSIGYQVILCALTPDRDEGRAVGTRSTPSRSCRRN